MCVFCIGWPGFNLKRITICVREVRPLQDAPISQSNRTPGFNETRTPSAEKERLQPLGLSSRQTVSTKGVAGR